MTLSLAQLGFVKGLLVIIAVSVLSYLGNAANLTGVINNPMVISIIVALAASLESHLKEKNGTGLFGAVNLK